MNIDACCRIEEGSIVKISDKRSKDARFENTGREVITVVNVDGCVIKDGPRADFVVRYPENKSVIVELKGSKVEYALKQIEATASHGVANGWLTKPIGALVVASRVPPAIDTVMQRGKRSHRLKYGAQLQATSSGRIWNRGDFF